MEDLQKLLHPEGLFNPILRFAFTNISDEDFVSYWDGQPIRVAAHQTVETSHHLIVKMTKELVDKIIIGEVKMEEDARKSPENPYFRSPRGMSLGVPAYRWQYEQKIARLLAPDEESPAIVEMRAKLKAEILANANNEKSSEPVHIPTSLNEFSQLGKEEQKTEKPPLTLRKIKNEAIKS